MATLLIVEDDIDTNEAVCEYLQDAGHHTISAFDGDEAITLFSENKINLVVLDIMLPIITGLAVLNSIRKTSQVPVLNRHQYKVLHGSPHGPLADRLVQILHCTGPAFHSE